MARQGLGDLWGLSSGLYVETMWKQPTHIRGALLTGAVCVVWFFLAARSPTLHYHFAPIVAAALWPLSLRSSGRATIEDARTGGIGAAVMVLATTGIIVLFGNMLGPNFLHVGPAWPEAVLFTAIAAAWSTRAASRKKPGLLGSLVDGSIDKQLTR